MGYIILQDINFDVPPTGPQTVSISYRKITNPQVDTIHLWSSSANLLASGQFSPEVIITGLDDFSLYEVYITMECGGTYVTQQYYTVGTPAETTTTTTYIPCNNITDIIGGGVSN